MKKLSLRGSPKPKYKIKKTRQNNYYPFGLKHEGYNDLPGAGYKYKFLNKEYEDSFALNVTETDYRQYDAALGRFNVMDMMTELAPSNSPYRYGFNNPVYFNDASGLFESYGAAHRWVTMWGLDDATIRYNRDKRHYEIENDGVSFYQQGEDIIRTMYSWSDSGGLTISYSTISGGAASNNSSRDPGYNPFGFVFTTKDGKDSPVTPSRGPRDAKTIDASIIEFFTDLFGPELTLGYEYDYKKESESNALQKFNYPSFTVGIPNLKFRVIAVEKETLMYPYDYYNTNWNSVKIQDSVRKAEIAKELNAILEKQEAQKRNQ